MLILSIYYFQLVISGAHHSANKQSKIPIIQGELFPILKVPANAGQANPQETAPNTKLPLIILTAHLDTFGLINVSFLDFMEELF